VLQCIIRSGLVQTMVCHAWCLINEGLMKPSCLCKDRSKPPAMARDSMAVRLRVPTCQPGGPGHGVIHMHVCKEGQGQQATGLVRLVPCKARSMPAMQAPLASSLAASMHAPTLGN
jgi:hypothetical protein